MHVDVKREFNEMCCRKCHTQFHDEGLLRGHEEVCQGLPNQYTPIKGKPGPDAFHQSLCNYHEYKILEMGFLFLLVCLNNRNVTKIMI